jgi:putative selenate reductase
VAELKPYPFDGLLRRLFREFDQRQSIFDLSAQKFFLGHRDLDFSVRFHNKRASTPFGPAAGPQSQLAQNIVLSWLSGARIIELKTVQILDQLKIPRPCIDMQTIGFNVEWSQELRLEQSLEEYVKGSMLIDILQASGQLPLAAGYGDAIFDMSVGYDLAGIKSARVDAFIRGMLDASPIVERLRAQISDEHQQFRQVPFRTRLSDTLTLSTFHGCPPDEIERIIDYLLREYGLHCVVKLNPTLLGPHETRRLLVDVMGYHDCHVPKSAFEKDTSWEQAVAFSGRLAETADGLGLGFGVKFNNTLIVENHRDFFPTGEREMYLSGRPLHVLAVNLVHRFRQVFGDRIPISFSAGVDSRNFAEAVALGLVPVTACSDLLKVGGYARASRYFQALADTIDDWIVRAFGQGERALDRIQLDGRAREACMLALREKKSLRGACSAEIFQDLVSQAKLLNTSAYCEQVTADSSYRHEANKKPPKKVGSTLALFDCLTCDKCIPVCPNDANFKIDLPPTTLNRESWSKDGAGRWHAEAAEPLTLKMKHQIGNFVDFCNECGNCDVFCPEDGGPYLTKPRLFSSLADWQADRLSQGFYLERLGDNTVVHGRFDGKEYRAVFSADNVAYSGVDFSIRFATRDPLGTVRGEAAGKVDLGELLIMDALRKALIASDEVTYVKCLVPDS